jgi:hypothetical protein
VVTGAVPVLPGPVASRSYSGPVAPGTVLAAVAPATRWSLTGPTRGPAPRTSSFGWGARFRVTAAGPATLRFDGGLVAPLSFAVSVVLWLAALALLMGRNLGRARARVRFRRRPKAEAGGDPDRPDGSDVAVVAAVSEPVS